MRRRSILLVLLLVIATLPQALLPGEGDAADRPNFVVFVIDDLDSASVAYMNAVNRDIVGEGMTFTHFFATTPLCCPSRASILRGQYAHNHGVLRNTGTDAGFRTFRDAGHEAATMAALLDAAGYETGLVGKYLNGYAPNDQPDYIPPGWDYWVSGVSHAAYSNYRYELNANGAVQRYERADEDYLTDVLAEHATTFLDRAIAVEQPFFLYVAPYAPHSPSTPARRHRGMFSGVRAPRTPAFNERNIHDKPEWVRRTRRLSATRIERIDQGFALRLESLQAVDEMIGGIVRQLVSQGVLDSTYIIFLSDNGYFLGEHRQPHGKDAPYDAASRVPLSIRGPGIARGSTTGRIALNIDVLPTMLDIAGLPAPGFIDGRSLLPLLHGNERGWRRAALLEGFGKETESNDPGEAPTPPFRALRTERILYVKYATGERELYDLRDDPYMTSNIVRDASQPLRRLYARKLDQLSTCAGITCRQFEDEPIRARNGR